MTVNTTVNRQSATGDGLTTAFDITDFKIQQATDVKVYIDSVLQSSGYTLVVNDPDDTDGGTVTFSSAPVLDADILFVRVVPYTQLFDMQYEENISESDINNAFDKLVMMLQQVKEITDRCLRLEVSVSGVDTELPDVAELAGYIPTINDDGDGFEFKSPSTIANEVTEANGDVNGPAVSTDSNLAAFNGTTGKLLKDSGITVPSPTGKAFYPTRVNSAGSGIEYQNIAITELTIASGSITPTGPAHLVDTEGDISSDELDTLATGSVPDGHQVILFAANTSRDVVIKHGTGNIYLVGNSDKTMDDDEKSIMLIRNGSNWYEANWNAGAVKRFTSTAQTPTAAAVISVAHGLGATPAKVWGRLVCTSADGAFSAGDVIPLVDSDFYSNFGAVMAANATNVKCYIGSGGMIAPNGTGGWAGITTAKWSLYLLAEL